MMSLSWRGLGCSLGLAAGLWLTASAVAAHADDPPSTVEVNLVPYVWAVGLGGSVTTPRGRTASFHQDIADVLSHLDGALMAVATLRYHRWVALIDFDYSDLSAKSKGYDPYLGQASLNVTSYIATVVGGYRVLDAPSGVLDVMIGTRIMALDNSLRFSGAMIPGFSYGSGDTWADPVFAVRGIVPLTSHLSFFAYGDVGGGPGNDLTGQVYGGLNYAITHALTAYAGYRYLSIRHTDNGADISLTEQGPMLGLGYRF